jgi:hypothetical protein
VKDALLSTRRTGHEESGSHAENPEDFNDSAFDGIFADYNWLISLTTITLRGTTKGKATCFYSHLRRLASTSQKAEYVAAGISQWPIPARLVPRPHTARPEQTRVFKNFHWHLVCQSSTHMLHEIRLAVRGRLRVPSTTVISVITVALGVGAGTALFSVMKAVLLNLCLTLNPAVSPG